MSDLDEEIRQLAAEFAGCQKILLALGDETRQHMILEMMQMGDCRGVRVGAITARTHLSRPAVSHHVGILRDAGILKLRREGTKNYYYFDADADALGRMMQMIAHAKRLTETLPDRAGQAADQTEQEDTGL